MATIAQMRERLQGIRDRAADTPEFIDLHAPNWRQRAVDVLWEVGRMERPEGMDVERWEQRLGMMARMVHVDRIGKDGIRVRLDQGLLAAGETGLLLEEPVATVNGIAITDTWIKQWVMARREFGDPLGKDLDSQDYIGPNGRVDYDQMTARIRSIIADGKMTGASIAEFVMNMTVDGISSFLELLVEAWRHRLGAVIPRDWIAYAMGRVKVDAPF